MQRVERMLELVESGAAVTRDLRRPERMEQGASDHPPATRRGIDIFDGLDGLAVETVQQELPQLAQWIVLRSRLLLLEEALCVFPKRVHGAGSRLPNVALNDAVQADLAPGGREFPPDHRHRERSIAHPHTGTAAHESRH